MRRFTSCIQRCPYFYVSSYKARRANLTVNHTINWYNNGKIENLIYFFVCYIPYRL